MNVTVADVPIQDGQIVEDAGYERKASDEAAAKRKDGKDVYEWEWACPWTVSGCGDGQLCSHCAIDEREVATDEDDSDGLDEDRSGRRWHSVSGRWICGDECHRHGHRGWAGKARSDGDAQDLIELG